MEKKKVTIKNADGTEDVFPVDEIRYHREHCILIDGDVQTLYNRRQVVSVKQINEEAADGCI